MGKVKGSPVKNNVFLTHTQIVYPEADRNNDPAVVVGHCSPGPGSSRGWLYGVWSGVAPNVFDNAIQLPDMRLGAAAYGQLAKRQGINPASNRVPTKESIQADPDQRRWLTLAETRHGVGVERPATHVQLLWTSPRRTGEPNQRLWLTLAAGPDIPQADDYDVRFAEVVGVIEPDEQNKLPEQYRHLTEFVSLQVGIETYRNWLAAGEIMERLRKGYRFPQALVVAHPNLGAIPQEFSRRGYRAFIEFGKATALLALVAGLVGIHQDGIDGVLKLETPTFKAAGSAITTSIVE